MHSFSISVLLRNPGTGHFPQPLRIADKWEDDEIVKRTLARRINVRVTKLDDLIREMASNWEFLEQRNLPKVDPEHRARFLAAWHQHREVYGYTLLAELPYALRQALHDHAELDGVAYDLLIVDEYQDLNACDLEALHLIADRGCSIVAAGDDVVVGHIIYPSAYQVAPHQSGIEGLQHFGYCIDIGHPRIEP
jgi:DNA helicase-2/ATP-dependent DNA helicase PcrA